MRSILIKPNFESWRCAARRLLHAGVEPAAVLWSDDADEASLFAEESIIPESGGVPKVSAAFLDIARSATAHTDPRRWGILYRMLWRITRGDQRHLLEMPTDPDTRLVRNWCKAVGRDIHKMHAFVRFRLVGVGEQSGREQFIAWFEPEYRIVRLATPFFVKRFANMDWSILTPHECAHWDGNALQFTPGVSRDAAPDRPQAPGEVREDKATDRGRRAASRAATRTTRRPGPGRAPRSRHRGQRARAEAP